ncbi:MAG TPA: metallophosphoesterase, partial [Noviherbaspirillum sp.]|nr:metallophosphoesterase [Noviherbaspirillum sp.]
WGRFKARTRPTPGNHEYYLPHAGAYFAYFGAAAGPARRGYYSFGAGTWRVVSLNSNLRPADHRLQLDWLAEELKANPARCILAFWHHPRFSSGEHGDHAQMTRAWTLLQAAGADVVLSAHEHLYERFAPQDADGRRNEAHGIRQFVVGTGGAPLDPFRGTKPNSEARNSDVHGVLKLTLRDGGYDWEFLAVEPDRYTDRGSGACKAAPSPSGDRP